MVIVWDFFEVWWNLYKVQFTILAILRAQFCDTKYILIVVQVSPPSIPSTLYHFKLKL